MPYEYEGDPDYEKFCDAYDEGGDPDLDDEDDEDYDEDSDEENYLIDGVGFADPGGNSALRAATPENPRNIECPQCHRPNQLTPLDKARGYRCDECSDRAERGGY